MNKILMLQITLVLLIYNEICLADKSTLVFPKACSQGNSIIIAAVGDILLHRPLLVKGTKSGFESLWQDAIPYIKSADIAYANLEGPMAFGINENGHFSQSTQPLNDQVYTGYPDFNYPPTLSTALINSGFHVISTANNHALDRFSIGVDKTAELLKKVGLSPIGTRSKNANSSWALIMTKKNMKIAWIACTEHTNDKPDTYHQILHCYRKSDRAQIMNLVQQLRKQVDAIIITPHWGEEYQNQPNAEQINFAHQVLNAGATAVIGSHPHVLQPLQQYMTSDGRTTIIMYSLGNFISYQGALNKRSTIILLLGLTKTSLGTFINGVRFVPMRMQNRDGLKSLHLEKLNKETILQSSFYSIFSKVLPMGNALYSDSIVTNPECVSRE